MSTVNHLLKTTILGSVNIGVYLNANNHFFLVPPNLTQKMSPLVDTLSPPENKIEMIELTVNQSYVLGTYLCMNNKGIIVPSIIKDEELDIITKKFGNKMKIGVLESQNNAFGNLICANDNGAIVSPALKENLNQIIDILDIEKAVVLDIAKLNVPGSSMVANSHGALCHPLTHDRHIDAIHDTMKVEVDVSTVNCGVPYLRSGAVANDYGCLFGRETTGPEAQRFAEILNIM